MTETCERCGTVRITTFRPDGGIAGRRYVYPKGYRTTGYRESLTCRTNGHTFPAGDTILR